MIFFLGGEKIFFTQRNKSTKQLHLTLIFILLIDKLKLYFVYDKLCFNTVMQLNLHKITMVQQQ